MKKSDFVEVSGYLRVLEKRLLDHVAIDRIAEAPGPDEALKQISQAGEYDFHGKDYEETLRASHEALYKMAYSNVPEPEVVDIAACRYDFHNIKVALKAEYAGTKIAAGLSGVSSHMLTPQAILSAVQDPSSDKEIPEFVREAVEAARAAYEQEKTPQSIDIAVDKCMFAHMTALCKILDDEFVTGYVQRLIDFYNARALVRSRDMGKGTSFLSGVLAPGGLVETDFYLQGYTKSPSALAGAFYFKYFGDTAKKGIELYERTGNYSELERLFDNSLVQYARQTKMTAYGAGNVFAYIMSKENEIRQIRIIMACKINGISTESLRERLRDNYA